ncbi:LLM class F420-dependent oxidoreductase [Mycobacterium sp.]|uniref:LLM class F420-dependent oxidoreductase n=1 Tax=Mycobacterium sp. TaxID=1785 RepID=UPI003C749746
MNSLVKVGVFTMFTDRTPVTITELAKALEDRGFESLWFGEHTHIPTSTVMFPPEIALATTARLGDPLVLLSAAAAVTTTLRLGTAVCLAAEREPIELAHEVATLDMISNGRVELGIGYGSNPPEMENRGLDPTKRRRILREKILAMKEIWQQDVASFEGDYVRFTESWSWPKPVQKPHPPILLGCITPRGFRHIAEFCDGWLPHKLAIPDENLRIMIKQLHQRAAEAGRDPASIRITMLVGAESPSESPTVFTPDQQSTMDLAGFRERCLTHQDVENYAAFGVERINVALDFPSADAVEPMLDHLAESVFG